MRIGGAFPLGFTANPNYGNGRIVLPSGGVFYPLPGSYTASLGAETIIQQFDPISLQWTVFGNPGTDINNIWMDGYNWRLINMSGVISGALITNAGSGGTNGIGAAATGVTIGFAAPAAGGALATATGYAIVGGSVQAPTVSQGGTGFLIPPLIVIDAPPPGGIQATAIAVISSAGVITGITMINVGAGYVGTPNFYILPQAPSYQGSAVGGVAASAVLPPGLVHPNNAAPGNQNTSVSSGALLTPLALTGTGTLTGIGMIQFGQTYDGTHIPAITITGAGAAAATALGSFCLTSITITSGGAAYGVAPNFISALGLASSATGFNNNNNMAPRPARGTTGLSGGVINATVIEDPGYGFQLVPKIGTVMTGGTPATTEATLTAVVGGINDTSFLQGASQ